MTPVQPMLAQSADDVQTAFDRIRPAAVEWKLDGARIQVHRLGDDVRVFTRNLADVTVRVPEIVEAIRRVPLQSAVLDAEAIALRPDGRAQPFGVAVRRRAHPPRSLPHSPWTSTELKRGSGSSSVTL